ncbi:hydroxyacid dehydrogenase [Kribbella endophytica]
MKLVVCVPQPESDAFFPPSTRAALEELASVEWREPSDVAAESDFAAVLGTADAVVTGWGFPRLDARRLALAPRLQLVMHSASSLRALVSEDFWRTGIPVSQAGAAMSSAVAELSLTFTLALLRRVHRLDNALRSGADWATARSVPRAQEIAGARIGVVGASRTGRRYVELCQALGAEIAIYDPYVEVGDPLAAAVTTLPELLAVSDVVAIHAPATDETHGLIGAEQLRLIRDGGLIVNTARPSILDLDALYVEVAAGRLDAALDVFDAEPLPVDDRWRALPNVLLTPHLGGATAQSRRRAGEIVVAEIRRHLAGEPLQYAVSQAESERMA